MSLLEAAIDNAGDSPLGKKATELLRQIVGRCGRSIFRAAKQSIVNDLRELCGLRKFLERSRETKLSWVEMLGCKVQPSD